MIKLSRDSLCKNCNHKIWFDTSTDAHGGWHHSYMLHNDNCVCRKPEPKEVKKDTFIEDWDRAIKEMRFK